MGLYDLLIYVVIYQPLANTGKIKTIEKHTQTLSTIKGPDNPTCQLLPKDNERKVKVQE